MKEIVKKLADRIYEKRQRNIIYRDKAEYGLARWFDKINNVSLDEFDRKTNLETSSQWIIDLYILCFGDYIDGYKLHQCIDFLNSNDDGNLIIGMNMLYNLEIKES